MYLFHEIFLIPNTVYQMTKITRKWNYEDRILWTCLMSFSVNDAQARQTDQMSEMQSA